jgi:drug/metabolite transporter (DMT)-like permease
MTQTMGLKGWGMVVAVGTLFGSSFLFVNLAVDSVSPLTLAAARALLAAPIVWLFLKASGQPLPRPGREWLPLLVIGVLTGALPFAMIAYGQVRISSGVAGILFGAIPVFTILVGHFLTPDERMTPDKVLGGLVGLGGVVLVIGPEALKGLGAELLGQAATLLAALSYTLGAIYGRLRASLPPPLQAAGQTIGGGAVLVPLALVFDAPWTLAPSATAFAALGAMALLSTALPSLLFFSLIKRAGATNASLATFLMPVTAVALGALVLGERIAPEAYAGLALILLGTTLVNGRLTLLARA